MIVYLYALLVFQTPCAPTPSPRQVKPHSASESFATSWFGILAEDVQNWAHGGLFWTREQLTTGRHQFCFYSTGGTSCRHELVWITGLCILLRVYQPIYVETSVRNKCRCSFYCALLTLYVSAPIGGHLQVVCNTVTAVYITNHLKMATNRGRNM
jgi:hypothetical protein